jgi:predicted metalloprotease with PDZ domain
MSNPNNAGRALSLYRPWHQWRLLSLSIGLLATPLATMAAGEAQPLPAPQSIPVPRDVPYPGVVQLSVDVTDTDHRLFKVHETLPVSAAGDLVLLFPQWTPGNHAPDGDLTAFTALSIRNGDTKLAWTRDPLNVFAFHVRVPKGCTRLDLDYQYVSASKESIGHVLVAHGQLMLDWQEVLLYPAGYFARGIQYQAHLTLPRDWQLASALEVESTDGAVTTFRTTPLEVLIDSPVEAGRYLKRYALTEPGQVPVFMDVMAEQAALTEIKPEIVAQHRALVQQAMSLFGSHHFNHYDFLYTVNDTISGEITVEHQRSGEYQLDADWFTDWEGHSGRRDDLAHEFTHSWDGKFRRPADLWVPNFNVPMRNSLLWVYEGGTEYWGIVLTARAGLWSKEQARDALAAWAAELANMPGRSWRNLQDTTNDEIINPRRPMEWVSWQRFENYYEEGALIWMEADTLIRERSGGKRSLDDFARGFFGVEDGRWTPLTYTFEDVVQALNAVEPYDWAGFLRQRLDQPGRGVPMDGLGRGGYRLVYTDTPSDISKSLARIYKVEDFMYSLGFNLDKDGAISDELWDSPAFKAGLAPGTKVIAVNGVAYESKKLTEALESAKSSTAPIELLVRSDDLFRTVRVDYHEGPRFPHLEPIAGAPARLDDILAPRPGG